MHPRSAKYFRSATFVFGPNVSERRELLRFGMGSPWLEAKGFLDGVLSWEGAEKSDKVVEALKGELPADEFSKALLRSKLWMP